MELNTPRNLVAFNIDDHYQSLCLATNTTMAGKLMGSLQTDLSTRLYRVTNGFNEALYLVANEPSLGMYRIQEHIQATVPKIVEQKQALQQVAS